MSFTSYINLTSGDGQVDLEMIKSDELDSTLNPQIIPGEVVIAFAENVLKFDAFSNEKRGLSGSLFCTNFKLSFVTAESFSQSNEWRLNNALIDEHSIALSNIESVFQGSAEKRKKLLPGTTVSSKCKTLKIHCKNFQIHTYSFKFSPLGHGKSVVNAILHHAFPPQIKLMFAFEYQIPVRKKRDNVLRYNSSSDWRSELLKCKCESGWRISQLNESFKICDSLPEAFVVPNSPVDALLVRGAPHFTGHRLLKWCWGNKLGNSIIRMAALDPAILESKQFQYMIENVERCHPQKKTPRIFTLENLLPTYKDIQLSFQKFKQFCISENATDFWEQDAEFTTGIESSKWLQNISLCLTVSRDVASTVLSNKISVILVENDDRDMNCVISSLAQLILDPQFRTVQGFQSLIQKEWVAMGHRFSQRLGHVRDNDQEESPLFLLFLDCVWQLCRQFPTIFEFNETYLTVLWDSTKLTIFETFLFDSPKQRFDVEYYTLLKEKRLQSVWDWTVQFAPEDTNLFINPLYVVSHEIRNYVQISLADERKSQSREKFIAKSQCDRQIISRALAWSEGGLLDVKCNPQDLALWEICYFRWLPFCQILSGGAASMYFGQQKLVAEILSLLKNIYALKNKLTLNLSKNDAAIPTFQFKNVLSKYDSVKKVVSSSFPFSSDIAMDHRSGYSIPVLLQKVILSDSNEELLTAE